MKNKALKAIITLCMSFVICLGVLASVPTMDVTKAEASSGVSDRINNILKWFPNGSYFSKNGQACTHSAWQACTNCELQYILQRSELSSLGYVQGRDYVQSWTCVSFANFAFRYIYGVPYFSGNYYTVATGGFNQSTFSKAKVGDIINFYDSSGNRTHQAVYMGGATSTAANLYHANFSGTPKVANGSWSYSSMSSNYPGGSIAIHRANNYDAVNGNTSTETPKYSKIALATYNIKNNSTGKYLSVDGATDTNEANVSIAALTSSNGMKWKVSSTSADRAYKLRPLCSSSRLLNPDGVSVSSGLNVNIFNDVTDITEWWYFEAVDGGYIIRNASVPSVVLDISGTNVKVNTYSASSKTQVWSLEPVDLVTPEVTYDKSEYQIGDTVKISWKASNTSSSNFSHYWIGIFSPAGEKLYNNGTGSTNSFTFVPESGDGEYQIIVSATPVGSSEGESSLVVYSSFTVNSHTHSYTSKVTKEATCTSAGVRTYSCSCGDSYTEAISAKGHTKVVDKAVAPTCTATGKTEGSHCSVCNAVIVAQQTVAAKGHTKVVDKAVAPTCTATGKTEGSHCSVCNAVIVAQQTVAAKGHTKVVDKAVAPTCTATGKTEGSHCSVCNAVIVAQQTVAAKGHTKVVDKAVAPTCTATGKTEGSHCSVCNAVIVAQQTVAAKGHSYTNTVVKPTATAQGYTLHQCNNCSYNYKDNYTSATGLAAPTEFSVTKIAANSITLGWKTVEGADGYIVEQLIDGKWQRVAKLYKQTNSSYTVTGLDLAVKYSFRIKAYAMVDGKGVFSAYTSSVSATTKLEKTTGLFEGHSTSSVTLSWDKVSGAEGYVVEQYIGSGEWKRVAKVEGEATTKCSITKLTAGTIYKYRIKAYKYVGEKVYFSTGSATVSTITKLATPTGKMSAHSESSVTLTWDKISGASGYYIEKYEGAGVWTKVADVTSGYTVAKTISDLESGTVYKYRVRAYCNFNGETSIGTASATITAMTKPAKTVGSVVATTADSATLSWETVNGADGYVIEVYVGGGVWERAAKVTGGAKSQHRLTGLTSKTTYKYRIKAYKFLDTRAYFATGCDTISARTK